MMKFNQMLKQAQSVQEKMQKMQEEIASREYEGEAGGTLVKTIITGKGNLKRVNIDNSLLNPEEKETLEDLIVAAFNNAKTKADDDSQKAMGNAFGDIPMPPGFKLPF